MDNNKEFNAIYHNKFVFLVKQISHLVYLGKI